MWCGGALDNVGGAEWMKVCMNIAAVLKCIRIHIYHAYRDLMAHENFYILQNSRKLEKDIKRMRLELCSYLICSVKLRPPWKL